MWFGSVFGGRFYLIFDHKTRGNPSSPKLSVLVLKKKSRTPFIGIEVRMAVEEGPVGVLLAELSGKILIWEGSVKEGCFQSLNN